MYQVDIGSVYVWPEPVSQLEEAQQLEIPEGFDSILVNSAQYVLQPAQIHHAYTVTFDFLRDEDQTQPRCSACSQQASVYCISPKEHFYLCSEHRKTTHSRFQFELLPAERRKIQANRQCERGHKIDMSFYCMDCNRGLCQICFITDRGQSVHHGHQIIDANQKYRSISVDQVAKDPGHESKYELIKTQMQQVLQAMMRLKQQTETEEAKLQ